MLNLRLDMTKQTLLLLYGGESSEHEVSVNSARNVARAVDIEKFNIIYCYISRNGVWQIVSEVVDNPKQSEMVAIVPGKGKLRLLDSGEEYQIDIVFPVLHGKNGEDGTMQGLLELWHVPFVGPGVASSAVAMDKAMTKQILQLHGIKTANFMVYRKGDGSLDYDSIVSQLGRILFVKPARAGSSIGVSRVETESQFRLATEEALRHDDKILIESLVEGRELELAVLGNYPDIKVSGVGEIIAHAEFYDYAAKYSATSKAEVRVQADISDRLLETIQTIGEQVYNALGCRGLSRIDFMVKGDEPYVIEVNTLPGFTDISMYPKLWEVAGVSYRELVSRLIELSQEA